jgi:hypothetical protein
MPDERTRSLRFGWEFLLELQASDNLTQEQRSTIEQILRHYPSGSEIKRWAKDCAKGSGILGPKMLPEGPVAIRSQDATIPQTIRRGSTTPVERTLALLAAYSFFRIELLRADNLTVLQKRQIPFVLRHFPESYEIHHWANMDAWQASQSPAFKPWLLPILPVPSA